MKINRDAYGQQLLEQYNNRTATAEIIERDDDYIDTGSDAGLYFSEYRQWSPLERRAIKRARGKILDIGCGAGRHSLYLQKKGFDVTGIDNSPGAIKVCKLRGLKKAFVRPISDIDKFKSNSFDTILMLGNNFGLFGDAENACLLLEKMNRITTLDAQIIAGTRNPYQTDNARTSSIPQIKPAARQNGRTNQNARPVRQNPRRMVRLSFRLARRNGKDYRSFPLAN